MSTRYCDTCSAEIAGDGDECRDCAENTLTDDLYEARACAKALAARIWQYQHLQLTGQLKELKGWRKRCQWLKLPGAEG